jgi:UDPglucose 6-dehydrogenase
MLMQDAGTRIGIIGDGVVGGALRAWFESQAADVHAYDPPKGLRDRAAIDQADVVFVCVPTPFDPALGFDHSYLLDAMATIRGSKLVVIKSTVLPGTTDDLQRRYPQHRFIFNPEFLREVSAVDDMAHPDRQIAGVTVQSARDAESLIALLPPAPFVRVCSARQAEMAKYVANSFLAIKVSFANEVADLCERLGIDYAATRDIVAADHRIGPSHFDALADGYRGYGGKCLPKDSKALLGLAERVGIDMDVLAAADAVNARMVASPPRIDAPRKPRVGRDDDAVTDVPEARPERRRAA